MVQGIRTHRPRLALWQLAALLPMLAVAETVDTAWVRRYDGPVHRDDWATCVAVDSQGSVIVAGASTGPDSSLDWATIKYSPDGESLWVRRLAYGTNDIPYGLGVDAQGNVYVSGYANNRITTVKYSPAGQLLWALPFGSAGGSSDLALNADGDMFLCGEVLRSTYDFVTIKYRPNGDTAWVRAIDWANDIDYAFALAVGPWGGPVVTGWCLGNSPYGEDILTVRYDSAGTRLWLSTYDGNDDRDLPADIAIDTAGYTYVTGRSAEVSTGWDYLTIKYSPAGETMWVRRYNGPANDWDEATALAADPSGGVVTTGYSTGYGSNYDYATIKYDSAGGLRWIAKYNGPGNLQDRAYGVALDDAGNVYVTGVSWIGSGVGADYATVKYSPAGETLWVRGYNGPGNWADIAYAIALDSYANTYVTGGSDGAGTGSDFATIKYVQGGAISEGSTSDVRRPTLDVQPNPFRKRTSIHLQLLSGSATDVFVHDAAGRLVRRLSLPRVSAPGLQSVTWDGTDDSGRRVSAGVYVIVAADGAARAQVKVLLLR